MGARLTELVKLAGIYLILGLLKLLGFVATLAILRVMFEVIIWVNTFLYARPENYFIFFLFPFLGVCLIIALFQFSVLLWPHLVRTVRNGRRRMTSR